MLILQSLLIFYFGACIGSFLNVVILRMPKAEKLTGRSHCPNCKRTLSALELVPLFSFLFLGGKCKACKKAISWRYFMIEGITASLFAFSWLALRPDNFGSMLLFFRNIIFVAAIITVFVIDLEHYLILDKILLAAGLPIFVLGLVYDFVTGHSLLSMNSLTGGGILAGFVFGFVFFLFWFFSKGQWMGFGDVKFMLFLGIALAWPKTIVGWMSAFILGAVFSIPLLLTNRKNLKSRLPFGTFLSLGGLIALFWGDVILKWYLSYLGF